jgi:hypothetical protein
MATWLIQLKFKLNRSLRQHRKSTLITWFIEGRAKWLKDLRQRHVYFYFYSYLLRPQAPGHHRDITSTRKRQQDIRRAAALQQCRGSRRDTSRAPGMILFLFVSFYFTNYIQIFKVLLMIYNDRRKTDETGRGSRSDDASRAHCWFCPCRDVGPNDGRHRCAREASASPACWYVFLYFSFFYYTNAIYLDSQASPWHHISYQGGQTTGNLVSLSNLYLLLH